MPKPVALIKMGRTPQRALRVIAAHIQTLLNIPVETSPSMAIPKEAFQAHRNQYDAGLILKHIAKKSFPNHSRVIAVTDVDLCNPILTYVFGQAELGLKFAIVSDFRLKCREDGLLAPEALYLERMAKVALHETAHTLTLYHCETPRCLMRLTPTLKELDGSDIIFCERCSYALRRSLRNLHE